jgi:hypothetical protein
MRWARVVGWQTEKERTVKSKRMPTRKNAKKKSPYLSSHSRWQRSQVLLAGRRDHIGMSRVDWMERRERGWTIRGFRRRYS